MFQLEYKQSDQINKQGKAKGLKNISKGTYIKERDDMLGFIRSKRILIIS